MTSDDVPLRDYLERRLDDMDRRIAETIAARRDALDAASKALDHRLDAMNAVRAQLAAQEATFARRDVLDQHESRLDRVDATLATIQGRLVLFTAAGALFGGTVTLAISHALGLN